MRMMIITIAALLLAAATTAYADTCYTDCWTDVWGNQHCTTRCSQF